MTKNESVRAGRTIDAVLHLLDRQVLDPTGEPVVAVDDLEVDDVPWGKDIPPGTPAPAITDLLNGPVLGTRIFGGRPPASRWERIAWHHVTDIGSALTIDVAGEELDLTWTERWVRERIIGRIPGGHHDPQ